MNTLVLLLFSIIPFEDYYTIDNVDIIEYNTHWGENGFFAERNVLFWDIISKVKRGKEEYYVVDLIDIKYMSECEPFGSHGNWCLIFTDGNIKRKVYARYFVERITNQEKERSPVETARMEFKKPKGLSLPIKRGEL